MARKINLNNNSYLKLNYNRLSTLKKVLPFNEIYLDSELSVTVLMILRFNDSNFLGHRAAHFSARILHDNLRFIYYPITQIVIN